MLFNRRNRAAETEIRRHRDRMAGLWAAELLGLIGHAAHDYAREVAYPPRAARQEEAGCQEETTSAPDETDADDEWVIARLGRDLSGKVSHAEIRDKLGHLWAEARRQLRPGKENDGA